jgi:hypothetical protein
MQADPPSSAIPSKSSAALEEWKFIQPVTPHEEMSALTDIETSRPSRQHGSIWG